MNTTTMTNGEVQGLDRSSNDSGVFSVFAIDHRDAMRALLNPKDPESVPAGRLTEVKLAFASKMSHVATAILLDPEYSAIEAMETSVIAPGTGLLCALESQGYLGDPHDRVTTLLPGWSVQKAKELGADGVKLLLLYRPDSAASHEQDRLVSEVIAECRLWDIPLFLEPISYPLADQSDDRDRRWVVCESARRLGALGPDVLKMQFPADTQTVNAHAWRDACDELDAASPVPWTVLSGGDPYESFLIQVETACRSGSSGFLVGRAMWSNAATLDPRNRDDAIERDVIPRFLELAAVATDLGRNWRDHGATDSAPTAT